MSEPQFKGTLREFLRTSSDLYFRKVVDSLLVAIESKARQRIGPKVNRVGVFGSYVNGGERRLHEIARKISDLGYASLMVNGFYLPKCTEEFHRIEEIIPLKIGSIFEERAWGSHVFYQLFPRLVSKAVFDFTQIRSQMLELDVCFESEIPSLGLIVNESVSKGEKNCRYLSVKKGYSECSVHDLLLCPYDPKTKQIFCPFFDSVYLSWHIKQFLIADGNYMVGATNLLSLSPLLGDFLITERIGKIVSKEDVEKYCQEFISIHHQILRNDLNYGITAIISRKKGSLVFFDFREAPGSFKYEVTDEPINIVLMGLPQSAFAGDLSNVEFEGTNVVRERNKLIIIKGDNSKNAWSIKVAHEDAFRELSFVGKMLSEEKGK